MFFMQVKHRIHTLTLAYVRLYQGAKSLLVELIIHFYALRRIILKQQKQLLGKFERCRTVGSHDVLSPIACTWTYPV